MDLTKPFTLYNGRRYYLLSRASLFLEPVFESPTVTALQAMVIVSRTYINTVADLFIAFVERISHVVLWNVRSRTCMDLVRNKY